MSANRLETVTRLEKGSVVCAVDVGTSAVRASLVSEDGTIICTSRTERPASEGSVDFDADRLWSDLVQTLRALEFTELNLECLAIAGHVGAVFLDESQQPTGRALGWANTVGTDVLQRVWGDPAAALKIAGRPAVTGGAAAYLAWLRGHDAYEHRRIRWVLSPKDDLVRRLSGSMATDATSAAYTLISDVRRRDWSPELAAAVGLRTENLPPQRAGTDIVGKVSRAAAAVTGLRSGLPIAAGGPDGTVGASAVLGLHDRLIVDVAGTTDVLTRVTFNPDDEATRDTLLNPYVVERAWSFGGPTGLTGGATAYWTRLLGLGEPAEAANRLQGQLDTIPPGCEGLFVLPFLTGSRFPDWQPAERGAIWGHRDSHTRAHLVRATQEASAFVVRTGLARLLNNLPDAEVVLAGGTARSDSLAQLRADVLERPVTACADPDVTLRGAAMLACVGAGIHSTLDAAAAAMAPMFRKFMPDSDRATAYRRLFDEWNRVRQMLANEQAGSS